MLKLVACGNRSTGGSTNIPNKSITAVADLRFDKGIDCIDYVTGIGNAHAHNGVHSVLRLG